MNPSSSTRPGDDSNVIDLVKRLTDQGAHLAQQQAALIQTEVQTSIDDLKMAIGSMAGAAVVGIAGLGVILMGVAYLLDTFMKQWMATLIVGVATLVVAYVLYKAGAKKMSATHLTPDRTKRTLKRTPGAAAGNL